MAQGGATDTGYSEGFIENIVKYIREKPDLVDNLRNLLKNNEDLKTIAEKSEDVSVEDIVELLKNNKEALDKVVKHFTENKKDLEILLEQASKVKDMEGKFEALGNQLSAQGIISAAAIATLTGIVAGSLAIGGVAGALMGGGLALAGLVALVAIAAIGYAIYQYRGEIKEGALDAGKVIKSFVKDLIDKLPTIQARENNFSKLRENLLQGITGYDVSKESEKIKDAQDKVKVIEMLQNEEQRSAIKELVEREEIKDFSKEDMKSLIDKGDSTHVEDMEKLKGFMDDFLPKIIAIGSDIKEVEEKVNEKVQKPPSKMEDTSSEPASPEEIKK